MSQPHKMVKHTQIISRFLQTNCLSVLHEVDGLALKGLKPSGLINNSNYLLCSLLLAASINCIKKTSQRCVYDYDRGVSFINIDVDSFDIVGRSILTNAFERVRKDFLRMF